MNVEMKCPCGAHLKMQDEKMVATLWKSIVDNWQDGHKFCPARQVDLNNLEGTPDDATTDGNDHVLQDAPGDQ